MSAYCCIKVDLFINNESWCTEPWVKKKRGGLSAPHTGRFTPGAFSRTNWKYFHVTSNSLLFPLDIIHHFYLQLESSQLPDELSQLSKALGTKNWVILISNYHTNLFVQPRAWTKINTAFAKNTLYLRNPFFWDVTICHWLSGKETA